jgi:hypothetical protein
MKKIIGAILFILTCVNTNIASSIEGHAGHGFSEGGASEGGSFHESHGEAWRSDSETHTESKGPAGIGPRGNKVIIAPNPFKVGTFSWWLTSPFLFIGMIIFSLLCALFFRLIQWIRERK